MLAITLTTASTWTAFGTLALAVVTMGLAIATFKMVRLTRRSLAQNQEDIALSRKEVEEAHRPVVVPIADSRKLDVAGHGVPAACKPLVNEGVLYVPIENVGSGPALDIEATVKLLDSAGGQSWAAGGEKPGAAAALSASSRIAVEARIHGLTGMTGFWLTLTYLDVAGKGWIVKARYIPDNARYEDLTINTQEEGPYGLRQDTELLKPVPSE